MDRPDGDGSDDTWLFEEQDDAVQAERPPPWATLLDRLRQFEDVHRGTSFVPSSENVELDVRRHPVLLVLPALRTAFAALAVLFGAGLGLLLLFALVTAAWSRGRHRLGVQGTGIAVGGAVAGLLLADAVLGPVLSLLLILGWLAEDVADWWTDRLVVSDRRIYRRYGVITRHSPSISLMAVAYLDASVPPLGRVFGYGTLSLDSVAQADAPLSRLDLLPDVVAVSHEILRLRTKAMPQYPPQQY